MFKFLKGNRLLDSNQSEFTPNYAGINQLVSITYNILKAFDGISRLEFGVCLKYSTEFRMEHEGSVKIMNSMLEAELSLH